MEGLLVGLKCRRHHFNCKHILVRINGDALVHLQPVDAAGLATAGEPFEACHFPRFFLFNARPHSESRRGHGSRLGLVAHLTWALLLALLWGHIRPGNPQFPFPPSPIWPGTGEGTPDSLLGRNRESGNPPFPAGDLAGISWSGS